MPHVPNFWIRLIRLERTKRESDTDVRRGDDACRERVGFPAGLADFPICEVNALLNRCTFLWLVFWRAVFEARSFF